MLISRTGLLVALAACAMPFTALAQQSGETRKDAPPQLEKLEEGEAPAVTIRKPDTEKKITEKREKGKVTEIKVKSGKSTYYLKPNEPAGSALPGDAQSNANRAPQWQVKEFELGGSQQIREADANRTPAPPEPAATPAKK
ncbi:MAG TPA: DUF2782 domain-containing protein [Burkholderiaceae bacterium]|nr:DUF2782 domain-containing protein [Burkholderiaceae bacterium]